MALKLLNKKNANSEKSGGDISGNTLLLLGLLKKFEKELKAAGKQFKEIKEVKLHFEVKPPKLKGMEFLTDNGTFTL